jgi:spore coat polysaccharide biosynthesis protein SpsF
MPSDEVVAAILHAAADHGVAELDTARAYGSSEERIGHVRADGSLDAVRVVTKVRPLDAAEGSTRVGVAGAVRSSADASSSALRAKVLDALLLHRAQDARAAGGAALDALDDLQSSGRIHRWGISVSSPEELLEALGYRGLGYVQLPFNLLDRRWLAPRIQEALHSRPEVRIVVRSALLQGLLSNSEPERWPLVTGVDPDAVLSNMARLVDESGRTSLLDLCVAYVLGHSWVDSVVLGVRSVHQLREVVDATRRPGLDAAEIESVHRMVAGGPLQLVDPSLWPPEGRGRRTR